MSYNADKKARLKDIKSLAARLQTEIDELKAENASLRSDIDDLAESLLYAVNASISNIDRGVI